MVPEPGFARDLAIGSVRKRPEDAAFEMGRRPRERIQAVEEGPPYRVRLPYGGQKGFGPGSIPTQAPDSVEGGEGGSPVIGRAMEQHLFARGEVHQGKEFGEVGGLGGFERNGDGVIGHAGGLDRGLFVGEAIGLVVQAQVDDALEAGGAEEQEGIGGGLAGGGQVVGDGGEVFQGGRHGA